ncbi:hypothetical protein V6N13_004143 [Hibiscus sabdariffa]
MSASGIVSLFVENIPIQMQWKGLWHMFARHGDVSGVYIARKLSRGGKRFGFVRYSCREDALRALERLNGCSVYGYRLTVKMANQNGRRTDRVHMQKTHAEAEGTNVQHMGSLRNVRGETNIPVSSEMKKIIGHVVDEELWKMKRSLAGVMTTICSVRSITSRLQEWRLGGIKVQRMGGKVFLLSFEDDELYTMLEDLNWSYLKEIFCKVELWSEAAKRPDRATWLEILGLPLHCWNNITLKRVAEI